MAKTRPVTASELVVVFLLGVCFGGMALGAYNELKFEETFGMTTGQLEVLVTECQEKIPREQKCTSKIVIEPPAK